VSVRRRKVLYVPGFDPGGPRRYHAIYQAESARQAACIGVPIEVGALDERGETAAGWSVKAAYDGAAVEVDYEWLRWNDIVRAHWSPEPLLFLDAWRSLLAYGRSGILGMGWRRAKLLVVASCMPVAISTAFLILSGLVLWGLCAAFGALAASRGWPGWAGYAPLVLLALLPFAWAQVDRLVPLNWLIRGMVFVSRAGRGAHAKVEARCAAFAERILQAAREPGWDEVLVVGHSVGAQLAARAMGKALERDPELGKAGPPVNLLTLGQLIPFYSLSVKNADFVEDFRRLVEARQIGWLDIESPADAGSVCAIHPLTGLPLELRKDRPVHRSPRFHKLLDRRNFARLQRRPLDFHFQYIMGCDVAGDYDFFRLTAGPDLLLPRTR
jgi:hypothetical protein